MYVKDFCSCFMYMLYHASATLCFVTDCKGNSGNSSKESICALLAKHTNGFKKAFPYMQCKACYKLYFVCKASCRASHQRKHLCTGGKFTKGGRWPLKLESLSLFVDILVEFDRILITIWWWDDQACLAEWAFGCWCLWKSWWKKHLLGEMKIQVTGVFGKAVLIMLRKKWFAFISHFAHTL